MTLSKGWHICRVSVPVWRHKVKRSVLHVQSSADTQPSRWNCGNNCNTKAHTQKLPLYSRHTRLLARPSLHTDGGWNHISTCNTTTTTTESPPHPPLLWSDPHHPGHYIVTSRWSPSSDGLASTPTHTVRSRRGLQLHVFSQSKLRLFSCHDDTHLTSGFHFRQSLQTRVLYVAIWSQFSAIKGRKKAVKLKPLCGLIPSASSRSLQCH